MRTKTMTSDEKFNHYFIGTLLLVLGSPIAALGLYGIWFAFTDTSADPGLAPAALFVAFIGGGVIWLAIALIRTARRAMVRSY